MFRVFGQVAFNFNRDTCSQAKLKLSSIEKAKKMPVPAEDLIKYGHRISASNAVSAPLTWQQGDPRRPYPTDIEMRLGFLARPESAIVAEQQARREIYRIQCCREFSIFKLPFYWHWQWKWNCAEFAFLILLSPFQSHMPSSDFHVNRTQKMAVAPNQACHDHPV